jgi:hypothetical protein
MYREFVVNELEPVPFPSEITDGRPLRGMELVMAQRGVPDMIIGEIAGRLNLEKLRAAAFGMQQRHQGLRAAVRRHGGDTARLRFEYLPQDPEGLVVEEALDSPRDCADPGRPLWQLIAEREAGYRFDVEGGYLFRVIWVPGDTGGHLIINCCHAVVDGISLVSLLHQLLIHYSELTDAQGANSCCDLEVLGATPAVLDQVRLLPATRLLARGITLLMLRHHRYFGSWTPFPVFRKLNPGDPVSTHARFGTGRPESFERVKAEAKSRGVTIGAVFAAAVGFATMRYLYEETGRIPGFLGRTSIPLSMDFSLRRYIDATESTSDQIGLFTGFAEVGVHVSSNIRFWDLAERMMRRTLREIRLRTPLLFVEALDSLNDLDETVERRGIDYRDSGGAGDGVNISNVGQYPHSPQYGSLRLTNLFGLSAAFRGGPMFIFWLRSVDGHFCYTATSAGPACARGPSGRFFADVIDLMEGCCEDSRKELRLSEYLPRPAESAL